MVAQGPTERVFETETWVGETSHPLRGLLLPGLIFMHAGGTFRFELTDEERERWETVLADFELTPPFAQLSRATFAASIDEGQVAACSGWSIHAGALLGMLRCASSGEWRAGKRLVGLRHTFVKNERVAKAHDLADKVAATLFKIVGSRGRR